MARDCSRIPKIPNVDRRYIARRRLQLEHLDRLLDLDRQLDHLGEGLQYRPFRLRERKKRVWEQGNSVLGDNFCDLEFDFYSRENAPEYPVLNADPFVYLVCPFSLRSSFFDEFD